MQYQRNDSVLGRGSFRVRGEVLEIMPSYAESAYRISLFGDEIEGIQHFDPLTGEVLDTIDHVSVWPASHYVTKDETLERAVEEIRAELKSRTAELEAEGKQLESHRLRQRTAYDIEMLKELGFTSGIENYSRILDGRPEGSPPHTLIDYFPDDFVVFVDESHQTIPQIGGMYQGDRSRKQTLVDYGFRLPSAIDNRPLRGTLRTCAAGCRSPRAAGSRSRPASACASGRPRTCRRSGDRLVGLVDEDDEVVGEVVDQGVRRAARGAAVEDPASSSRSPR